MTRRDIFIAKAVNYGASKSSSTKNTALTPDTLADGAIGIYGFDKSDNKFKLVIEDSLTAGSGQIESDSTNLGNEFIIAQGVADGSLAYVSSKFNKNDVVRIIGREYVAPVLKVIDVDPVLPSSGLTTDYYGLTIIDESTPDRIQYTLEIGGVAYQSGGTMEEDWVDAFIAKAAAITDFPFTLTRNSSGGTSTLRIAATLDGQQFRVVSYGTKQATVTTQTAMVKGEGTYAEVSKMEKLFKSHQGYLNTVDGQLNRFKPGTFHAVVGQNYDLVNIDVKHSLDVSGVEGGRAFEDYTMVLAFCDAAGAAGANEVDFLDIITYIVGASKVTSNINTGA